MRDPIRFLAAAALISACGGAAPSSINGDEQFISVNAAASSAVATSAGTTANSDNSSFYLAINKSELGKKYFLSAYLTQYFPGAVSYGAARSLGTRVVSFKVQNGKLFVFDAADGKKDSNTFDPSLIVDAYPIVTSVLPGPSAANFVVFDPARGMNQFGLLSDAFAGGAQPARFNIELSYLQRYRKIGDGVTFEQVFTGYSDQGDPNSWQGGENNAFRGSGTLGIALRKYGEGAGFTPAPVYDSPFFFMGDTQLVPNSGQLTANSIHWNVKPGMKPIQWKISDKILNAQKDPKYAQYDVAGALKAAVENWNAVFGFTVFQASVAAPTDSYGDDDTNYVLWDEDPTFGAAFANWRNNPNTGEIRGASVYMNALWLQDGDAYFNPQTQQHAVRADGTPELVAAPAPRKNVPTLTWLGVKESPLCVMFAPSQREGDVFVARILADTVTLTPKQKVEAFLTHVLLHEIGHTLGLRHNFAGSLLPPSSSVMDYLDNDTSILVTKPGAYDTDAVKLLYGLSQTPPAQPFCTDEDTQVDPHCNRFDYPGDPMTATYLPLYQGFLDQFLTGQTPSAPNNSLNNVLKFVRNGSPSEIPQAWSATISAVHAPLTSAQLQQAGYAPRADFMARRVLSRLFLDAAGLRGTFAGDPSVQNPAFPQIFNEVVANLQNVDAIRSFTTRRAMVDILARLQIAAAYDALVQTRAQIAAQRAGMTGVTAELTDDLLARIDAATHPYFK